MFWIQNLPFLSQTPLLMKTYDTLVIGAGHAGCEAALASARLGSKTLVLTISLDKVAHMPCNPAIGGLAKGHLTREIDALGGEMAKAADWTGIQFRILNRSKGHAARGTRCQSDMQLYHSYMLQTLQKQDNLELQEGMVESLIFEGNRVVGINTGKETLHARTVIVTTGTFLNGITHCGRVQKAEGRVGDPPSIQLSQSLADLKMGRLKTGTPARLDRKTINYSALAVQWGEVPIPKFSFWDSKTPLPQRPCYMTYTNPRTHEVILKNLKSSAMYSGAIQGVGPRYCPSIEDKLVNFKDKPRHQIFLEPTGLNLPAVYPNGISTSLPAEVQLEFIRTIEGLEEAEILQAGYAVEYDFVMPNQLLPTLEMKSIKNLFFAGQVNGTSGYEEAAAQGLIAGINAARNVQQLPTFSLKRSDAYIGVLIDDLVTKGTNEPYRMFTSRSEHRLSLREDNADLRLSQKGWEIGLLESWQYEQVEQKRKETTKLISALKQCRITPSVKNEQALSQIEGGAINKVCSAFDLLKRSAMTVSLLAEAGVLPDSEFWSEFSNESQEQSKIEASYEGYISRQNQEFQPLAELEKITLPQTIDYSKIAGLSNEVVQKLKEYQPLNLGQAQRISGITPVALNILKIYLKSLYATRQ